MDLCEKTDNIRVHPWEKARLRIILNKIKKNILLNPGMRILEIGCGDGFVVKNLSEQLPSVEWSAIDIALTDIAVQNLNQCSNVAFYNKYDKLKTQKYDVILLLDVLEHIKQDKLFLKDITNRYLKSNGSIVITVPAFQRLFSSHDIYLKHYRRYNAGQLKDLVCSTNIDQKIQYGYFFISLLFIRMVSCLLWQKKQYGVGSWKAGAIVTYFIEKILLLDAMALTFLTKFNITLPGLSLWMILKK